MGIKITILTHKGTRPIGFDYDIALFEGEINPMDFEALSSRSKDVVDLLKEKSDRFNNPADVVIYSAGPASILAALINQVFMNDEDWIGSLTVMHFDAKSQSYLPQRLF